MPGLLQLRILQHNGESYHSHAGSKFFLINYILPCNQETCNLLIEGARRFLDPSSIFQIEVIHLNRQGLTHVIKQVEEGLDKVKISIRNLKEFKTCFQVYFSMDLHLICIVQEYKTALPSYFTDQGKDARSWEFQVTKAKYCWNKSFIRSRWFSSAMIHSLTDWKR